MELWQFDSDGDRPAARRPTELGTIMCGWITTAKNVTDSSDLAPTPASSRSLHWDNALRLGVLLYVESLQWLNASSSYDTLTNISVRLFVLDLSGQWTFFFSPFRWEGCCVRGWLENKGAAGRVNYLTTCFKLPLPFISIFSTQLLSNRADYLKSVETQQQRADCARSSISILTAVHVNLDRR